MHLSRIRRRALLAAALPTAVAAFALPSAAQAGTASTLSDGTLLYADNTGGGEHNNVTMRSVGGKIVISDTALIRTATNQCKVFNGDLECASHQSVRAILGPQDDRIEYRLPHAGLAQMGDGNDTVVAGTRENAGRTIQPVEYRGESGFDVISYEKATSGVSVDMADRLASDGRPGADRENVASDFEHLFGSPFRDTLFGTPNRDGISGGGDRDVIAGGFGDDYFYSPAKDGADDYHGGPGSDMVLYVGRTQPLDVTLDNIANDGETNGRFTTEADLVRTNVENVAGGSGDDRITSFGTSSRFEGLGGDDTLTSGGGADTLIGGPGLDAHSSGGGSDVVDARDNDPDFVDCGTERDTLSRDNSEGVVRGCETVNLGVLKLASEAIVAEAGEPARVKLGWRHPDGWRKLRSVTLRLMHDGVEAGEVTIRPRDERITADGAVRVARRATRLTRSGKTVSAKLALRIDPSLAGRKLGLEVEATDTSGRRQLETDAGTLRVR